jgi:hypothetical protein
VTQVVRSTKDNHVQLVVDANGRYAVKVAEQVVFESRVLAAAEIYYAEESEKHRVKPHQYLVKERAHFDAQALHSDASAHRRAIAWRKGGKGRGGVG